MSIFKAQFHIYRSRGMIQAFPVAYGNQICSQTNRMDQEYFGIPQAVSHLDMCHYNEYYPAKYGKIGLFLPTFFCHVCVTLDTIKCAISQEVYT